LILHSAGEVHPQRELEAKEDCREARSVASPRIRLGWKDLHAMRRHSMSNFKYVWYLGQRRKIGERSGRSSPVVHQPSTEISRFPMGARRAVEIRAMYNSFADAGRGI